MTVLLRLLLAFAPADVPTSAVDGVTVQLFAEHPQIVTPTGIAVGPTGTVFVAESHTHFRPDDYDGPKTDQILVLKDSDGNGRADERTVFHEGFTHVMDLETAPDGSLYVATRMDVHRLKDTSGDGKADDVTPVVQMRTTGTYPHNGISGLCFNADGSLNFGLGENLGHDYTLIGTDGVKIRGGGEGGSTYRVGADGTNLRRISTGWWNPFGMCVDSYGRVFGTDNDPGASPPCRLIQVHEGADYGYEYRYGRTGLHPLISWTGDLPGNIPMIAGTGEAPCGIVSAELTNLPYSMRPNLLVACWADHRIDRYEITQPEDSGQVRAIRRAFITGSNDFRPVDLAIAPNGDLYVTDWVSSSYQLHGLGRVWVVRSKPLQPRAKIERTSVQAPPPEGSVLAQIHDLKTATLASDRTQILAAARHRDPLLRHAAIQALTREVETEEFQKLAEAPTAAVLLAMKRSPRRKEFAAGDVLQRGLASDDFDTWSVAVKWIADDVQKEYLRDLTDQLNRKDLTVQQYLMLAAALDRLRDRAPKDLPSPGVLTKAVKDASKSPALRAAALRLLNNPTTQLSAVDLVRLSRHSDSGLRIEAIRAMGRWLQKTSRGQNARRIIDRLRTLVASSETDDAVEAVDALTAAQKAPANYLVELAGSERRRIAEAGLRGLVGVPTSEQFQADLAGVQGLSDADELIARLRNAKLDRPASTDTEAWLDLLSEDGDPVAGERIFFHTRVGTCGRCHQHNGRGAAVGPSLSLFGRRLPEDSTEAKRWLLETILQPSKDIAPQYATWSVVLTNGKVLTGLPRRKGGKAEAYLGLDGKEFSVKKEDIEFHQETGTSIMPEGLLQNLTVTELQDLFAFLMSSR